MYITFITYCRISLEIEFAPFHRVTPWKADGDMLKIPRGRKTEDRGAGFPNSGIQVWVRWIAEGWLDRDEARGKVDAYQGWRIVVEAGVVGLGVDSARASSNGSARMYASACLCQPSCVSASTRPARRMRECVHEKSIGSFRRGHPWPAMIPRPVNGVIVCRGERNENLDTLGEYLEGIRDCDCCSACSLFERLAGRFLLVFEIFGMYLLSDVYALGECPQNLED